MDVSECLHETDDIWGGMSEPSLFIVGDIFIAGLKGEERRRLDKVCSWASTHRNVSIIVLPQGVWQVDIKPVFVLKRGIKTDCNASEISLI